MTALGCGFNQSQTFALGLPSNEQGRIRRAGYGGYGRPRGCLGDPRSAYDHRPARISDDPAVVMGDVAHAQACSATVSPRSFS